MKESPDGAYLPIFLSVGNIKPFIDNELSIYLGRRRTYHPKKVGTVDYGVTAMPEVMPAEAV